MNKQEIIDNLTYYYEVDLDNCLMTHKDWIEQVANALTDRDYLCDFRKEFNQYKEERI